MADLDVRTQAEAGGLPPAPHPLDELCSRCAFRAGFRSGVLAGVIGLGSLVLFVQVLAHG